MAHSVRVSVLMAAAIAAAIAAAPAAGADPRGGCDQSCSGAPNPLNSDFSDLPQGWTNEAQFAKPGNNPFGAGPNPPILALD